MLNTHELILFPFFMYRQLNMVQYFACFISEIVYKRLCPPNKMHFYFFLT